MQKRTSVRCLGIGRFLLAVGALTLAGCSAKEQPIKLYGEAQGTYYSVQYYDHEHRDFGSAVDSILKAFDGVASLWVDSSEIQRVNRNETDSVSPMFADILQKALYANQYTDGAFDCRIGRIVRAWGFGFSQREEVDSVSLAEMLLSARGTVRIDSGHIAKQFAETELDFNAIAQGYTSDIIAQYLDGMGIESYLVDVGGEVVARGKKTGGSPWKVGIERPASDKYSRQEVQTAIRLEDCSVVTSGSYRKYYEKDGARYSHTINPTTGKPVEHSLLSVSVIERESWMADVMATAYMVMGMDSALRFMQAHPGQPGTEAVYFIYDDHGSMKTYATPAFQALITD